jgi:tRNA A-37 threonylcarbamoyl transferase component Bud32
VRLDPLAGAEVLAMSDRGGHRRQLVLKIEHRGTPLVVKCYGRKRGALRAATRALGCMLLGKSSPTIEGRFLTECETLALWRREGFDVPAIHPLDLSEQIPGPYLVMEWISGPLLARAIRGPRLQLETKREVMERFGAVCGARHARAIELGEPRLLYDHPTLAHVLVGEDRLVHIDFELVWRRVTDLDRLARREIAGFLTSVSQTIGDEVGNIIRGFVESYPDRGRLERLRDDLLGGRLGRRRRYNVDAPAIQAFVKAL